MDESAVDDFLRYMQSFKVRFDANGDNQERIFDVRVSRSTGIQNVCHKSGTEPLVFRIVRDTKVVLDQTSEVILELRLVLTVKVRFDANGDIRITRREYDQLDAHFRTSVKMAKSCASAGNVNGVKEELYKIYYMIELINKYYLKPNTKNYRPNVRDIRKDMMDLRAVMLSAFKQYLEWVTAREPDYNFQRNYKVSDYASDHTDSDIQW